MKTRVKTVTLILSALVAAGCLSGCREEPPVVVQNNKKTAEMSILSNNESVRTMKESESKLVMIDESTEIEQEEGQIELDRAEKFEPAKPEHRQTYRMIYCTEECPGHKVGMIASSDEIPTCEEDGVGASAGMEDIDVIEETPEKFTIDLSFVGDVMLATHKGEMYEGSFSWYAQNKEPTYFLEKAYETFSTDDFTVVNLENVLTDNKKLKETDKGSGVAYWYKAPTSNTEILTSSSVEAVSLANNHYSDYGMQGRADTVKAVEDAGLLYGTNEKTIYLEKNGFKIAVICHGLWNESQGKTIEDRLQQESKKNDYQIVFHHGGTERVHKSDQWRIEASRGLVDAGADLVIGNHPHVLQPTEVYKGVNIVYSLGNFCFGGSKAPENRTIIYKMEISIENEKVVAEKVGIIPYYVYTGKTNNWQPAPITNETEKQRVLDFMVGKVDLPY